ncbi:hypothetical protein E3N88_13437 [Mikania micrantha]|uniref:ATP-dependent DNA helicase n=1 Tax=Mikania micrantha TaxID=192012 RepID=A0A5N6P9M5_9ASTR|nr:hypothetical protein E3N88_13437 [Mikania micrantha]
MSSSQRSLKRKSQPFVAENVSATGCSSSIMHSSITLLPDSTIQRPRSCVTKRQSSVRAGLLENSHVSSDVFTARAPVLNSTTSNVSLHCDNASRFSPLYDDLGDCSFVCELRGATFWFSECLKSFPLSRPPKYSTCCRTARDMCHSSNVVEYAIRLYAGPRQQSYDLSSMGSIGCIVHDGDALAKDFDIIVRNKDNIPHRINNLHPLYMSLQYPLLFPFGNYGWSPSLKLTYGSSAVDRRLTMNMFYSYQIHDRKDVYTLILHGGRRFQQYLVDAYICIERNRLDYITSNQTSLRVEFLCGLHDAVSRGDTEGQSVGKRIFLPSTFTGSPRYMYKHYQDALAICRVHGNPQYFITFTCNVKWPEIVRYMKQITAIGTQDRPDIIARVFQMKVDALMDFLRNSKPFGDVDADVYTIEFQKRGLPHCHILLWVTSPFKIREASSIDKYISAEIPDKKSDPILYQIITDLMMHGPCGTARTTSPCMRDGICSKHFPKKYEPYTRIDKNGCPHYKRPLSGPFVIKNGVPLDNAFVVPYNKMLCTRFVAHINVEYCGWSMLIKYLFKYISKGADRIRYTISPNEKISSSIDRHYVEPIDEIKNFVDGRYICPHEAAWRILDFHIDSRRPAVQTLAIHLENKQNVTFKDSTHLHDILRNPSTGKTTLTEWLRNNSIDSSGRHLRYVDYLSEYRWDSTGKVWLKRASTKRPSIGRLVYVHPTCGDLFYLRTLLTYQIGCRSFSDIRTIAGFTFATYRAACEKLGLIGDDKEWVFAFGKASAWATASELRSLFTHMLLHCEISNPLQLWNTHWQSMSDDITMYIQHETALDFIHVNENDIQQHVLYELEKLLNSASSSTSLSDFGLPMPSSQYLLPLRNRLILEERCYDRSALHIQNEQLKASLHPAQSYAYELAIQSVMENKQLLLFVYGHGGTGKTHLWTAIISALRSFAKIVLAVAASGIASLLLPYGRTTHSRFKIPIDLSEESICNIKKNTQLSQLVIESSLIIWDEAPMSDRRCFESLDRTLRNILEKKDVPFGGKSVLLGGDFRQTLPIKVKATKSEIISLSLPMSYLWKHFQIMKLTENMRLQQPNLTSSQKEAIDTFSKWLLSIGDGIVGDPVDSSSNDTKRVEIPDQFLIKYQNDALMELIHFIYDTESLHSPTAKNLAGKAIVCPKNENADKVNKLVLQMAPGNSVTYLSTDSIIPRTSDMGDTENLYPIEYLNSLTFTGLPAHQIDLKPNVPIILIRNIDQSHGLCNGTRLIISQLFPRIIQATVITGTAIGHRVFIPRITFTYDNKELPFVFKRKQFPIQICYAMTINKSQGQLLSKIGVFIPQPVFSHGQLYVAFSRARSPDSLKIIIVPQEENSPTTTTNNVVFSDFLKEVDVAEGDAIQVFSEDDGNDSVCASIKIMNCYRLERYVCSRSPAQMKVVAHPAALRIGRASSIIPIDNHGHIPSTYFSFINYDHLRPRLNNHQVLTGRIDDAWYENTNNGTVMRLKIEDPVKEPINITLWPEIACSINTESLINTDHLVVAAVRSLKVTEFRDKIQLESTSATHVYVDPDIDIAKSIATTYCLAATLADNTGSISVTIFDQAITSVIGISCYEMVVQRGYTDTTIILEPLQSIKGQDKIYRLERGSASSPFKVNRIFSVQEEASTPSSVFQTTTHDAPAPDTPVGKSTSLTDTKRQLFPQQILLQTPIN